MKVLVLGAGGSIGGAIAKALVASGHSVVATRRKGHLKLGSGITSEIADRAQPQTICALIGRHNIDALIDVAAYHPSESAALVNAIDGKIGHYLMLSSGDVYRNYGCLHRREAGSPDPGLLTETAPLRTHLYPYRGQHPRAQNAPDKWMDDYDKIPIERAVQSMHTPWTILRLPLVYGPGDRQMRFRWALAPMLSNAPHLNLPKAWAAWTVTYTYVENIAAGAALAVGHPKAQDHIFNVTDEVPVAHHIWIDRFQVATGWQGEVIFKMDPAHPLTPAIDALDLSVSLKLSGAQFCQTLGFRPPTALNRAIEATLASEQAALEK